MKVRWLSLSIVVALALTHIFGGKLDFILNNNKNKRWFNSFASGVGVAYVIIHMLPMIADQQELLNERFYYLDRDLIVYGAYLTALLGFMAFYLGNYWAVKKDPVEPLKNGLTREFLVNLLLYVCYNFMVGYTLGSLDGFDNNLHFFAYLAGYIIHFLANELVLHIDFPTIYKPYPSLLAICVLLGWGLAQITSISQLTHTSIESFVAGAMMLCVIQKQLEYERDVNMNGLLTGLISGGILFYLM